MMGRFCKLTACVCAVAVVTAGLSTIDTAEAQNRRRPAQKKKAKPKPKPKPKLPTIEVNHRFKIAPVDPSLQGAAKGSAQVLDGMIEADLKKHGQKPNPMSTDEQFVRRIYLDITGTIPTARETRSFLRSTSPSKRERLIDRLLNTNGYASHMFNYWADVLRIVDKSSNNTYTRPFGEWLKQSLRDNKPYDKLVNEMLAADGRIFENPAVGYTLRDPDMPLDHLNNTVRIFLGTRIGCAQCHDHPFDRWKQKEFYQLAAFIGGEQTRMPGRLPKNMLGKPGVPTPFNQGKFYKDPKLSNQSREGRMGRRIIRFNTYSVWENPYRKLKFPHDYQYDDAKPGQVAEPAVIFGDMPQLTAGKTRREAFADWVTDTNNPRFAKTIANRMWKRAFGVGLIEPEDDIRDETVATNPAAMEFLVNQLKRSKYNLKEFMRIIYNTKAYQRQVTYTDLDPDEAYRFPGPILRRMTAEQVWDSLLTLSLENPEQYQRPSDEDYNKIVAVNPASVTPGELVQKGAQEAKWRTEENKERRKYLYKGELLARASELPQPLPDAHFIRQFGQSDREIIQDGSTEGTVPQILTMFNGPVTHMMLEEGSVLYNEVVRSEGKERLDMIFLSILGREPTMLDRRIAAKEIRENKAAGYGDVIWALLNTREFLFVQ